MTGGGDPMRLVKKRTLHKVQSEEDSKGAVINFQIERVNEQLSPSPNRLKMSGMSNLQLPTQVIPMKKSNSHNTQNSSATFSSGNVFMAQRSVVMIDVKKN
jgi:hypothetical protein